MDIAAVIVAAGRGTRAGEGLPKQYRMLADQPVITHTIRAILSHPLINHVTTVIHRDDRAEYDAAIKGIDDKRLSAPVIGADTRARSVYAGLNSLIKDPPRIVLIHDAARPFVTAETLDCVISALDAHDGAFPALPVADALWQTDPHLVSVPRNGLVRAQTPQGFDFAKILKAHAQDHPDAADDVALAAGAGLDVVSVEGDDGNFKLTVADDFRRAEARLNTISDIRTGQGYDVHAFVPGDAVVLCGVPIPFDQALSGHSDADVAMHAITDAIYGALADGDIGQHFPPSDPQWKGAASSIFLEHAAKLVAERSYEIANLDCTIICEAPKIGPHAKAMRSVLASIVNIAEDRISVKATTSERLGFTGRQEGIAATATATLVRR